MAPKTPLQCLYTPVENREVFIIPHEDKTTKCLFIRWEDIQSSFTNEVLLVRADLVDVKFMVNSNFKKYVTPKELPVLDITPTLSSTSTSLNRLLDSTEMLAQAVVIFLLCMATGMLPLSQDCPAPSAPQNYEDDTPAENHSSEKVDHSLRSHRPFHPIYQEACLQAPVRAHSVSLQGPLDPLVIQPATTTPIINVTCGRDVEGSITPPPVPEQWPLPSKHGNGMHLDIDSITSLAALSPNEDQALCDIRPGDIPRVQSQRIFLWDVDRLAIIYGHARTLLLHEHKLFESPLPRLFIVLPASSIGFTNHVTPKFRLHFLCECSSHVDPIMTNIMPLSNVTRHVHLARHEGYDLLRPKEFFTTYGKHVLTVLEMVKHGITTTDVEVPPLETFKLLDGINENQYHGITKENINSKLDYAIRYVKHQLNSGVAFDELAAGIIERQPLDVEDLNRVGNFIQNDGIEPTLANLYRAVTSRGQVRWICLEHYRDIYSFLVTQSLSESYREGLDYVNNHLGKVEVLLSLEGAARFYEALRKTSTVYDLCVTYAKEATESDLQELCDAVRSSNVAILSLSDAKFDSTIHVGATQCDRLAPIIRLLASGHLQGFSMKGSKLLGTALGNETTMTIQKLYDLKLGLGDFSPDVERRLDSFVHCLPHLNRLSLYCDNMAKVFGSILTYIEDLEFLSTLTLSTSSEESVLRRESRIWEWTSVDCNLEDILRSRAISVSIILPFGDETLASDIIWFDALYEKRVSPLTVVFVGKNNEIIVKAEFRQPESNNMREAVGQYFRGPQSTINLRWRDQEIQGSLGWRSSALNAVKLDFQAMKNQGIRRILQSLDISQPSELQMDLCKLDETVMQLVVYGIRPASWACLTRLDLRGRGHELDNWIGSLRQCFERESIPSLRALCLVGTTSTLSDGSVEWIESILWWGNKSLQAVDTITLESIDLTESQWDVILASIELSKIRSLSFAGSTVGQSHIYALLQMLPNGTGLIPLVLNGISWVKDLKDSSFLELEEMELELLKKSSEAKIYFT
ncbi:hypothetical protein BGZ65_003600 [Modicella reniformis]|uniref:Uncharacterized protein n=1 Tax=Modicella reniformis TaxID=1440133 RepID=A0A9P6INP1_9FUNG|nr:hypothetical protein BGZ65_003600 [Modicella reniformis]